MKSREAWGGSEIQDPQPEGEKTLQEAPENWFTINELLTLAKGDEKKEREIYETVRRVRLKNPQLVAAHKVRGQRREAEYYSVEPFRHFFERNFEQKSPERIEQETGQKIKPGHIIREREREILRRIAEDKKRWEGWLTSEALYRELEISPSEINIALGQFRRSNPKWFGTDIFGNEYFSLELVVPARKAMHVYKTREKKLNLIPEIKKQLSAHRFRPSKQRIERLIERIKEQDRESGEVFASRYHRGEERLRGKTGALRILIAELENEDAPSGWISVKEAAEKTSRSFGSLQNVMRELYPEYPDEHGMYRGKMYYSPRFIEIFNERFGTRNKNDREAQKALETQCAEFVASVAENQTLEAQEFNKLLALVGGGRVSDILYKFRPEFKGLSVEYVKGIIADYLGDFLVVRKGFAANYIDIPIKYFEDPSLEASLREVVKHACLEYYHSRRRNNSSENDQIIIEEYIKGFEEKAREARNTVLQKIAQDLREYYVGVLGLAKPQRIVDHMQPSRDFPDLNQRINIKELFDKKRVLIADDMGLGKSASAILAKETLGVRQAIVVAPSNVIDTWQGYLKKYFREGAEPNVLVVESVNDVMGNLESYDYILISHERLNDEYAEALLSAGSEMLIVDEVHKLKNVREGVRSSNLLRLAEQINNPDKYLAILSGTPVPNKVEDVAMILRLLYPTEFEKLNNRELVQSIIKGDAVDLRSLLVPRMQMKSLRESVDMPQHTERPPIEIYLSETERDIYEMLMEEDELTASKKIQVLRQFLLNPDILFPTPGIEGSKYIAFQESLNKDFEKYGKIVVFFNGYVEGILRGENSLAARLKIPADVELMVVEGSVSPAKREQIQHDLNRSEKRILLLVSGQTADVGIDFSGGELVYFYNEPWTKYDQAQQLARTYRPGLKHDLESQTLIARGTIEEGIHRYIEIKQRSVEKLLRGIPLTELEKELLQKGEDQPEGELEVHGELAQYYLSSQNRLLRMFAGIQGIGQSHFQESLKTIGQAYAETYADMGSRSYQANGGRVTGAIIHQLITEDEKSGNPVRILDIASGPETLKRHIKGEYQNQVISLDINQWHFREPGQNRVVGGFVNLPFQDDSMDYANLSFAFHYSSSPQQDQLERVRVLMELNRVTKNHGKAVINFMYSVKFKNEANFKKVIEALGFEIIPEYSGEAKGGTHYRSTVVTLEKTRPVELTAEGIFQLLGKDAVSGLEFLKDTYRPKDTRRVINTFVLAGAPIDIELNSTDKQVFDEEERILDEGKYLKDRWGDIQKIPSDTLVSRRFSRIFNGTRYVLYKKLTMGGGIAVIK